MIRLQKHIQILSILLALGCASTNTWVNTKESDLIKAANDGDLSRVQALIAAKADVNAKTDKGVTALILASARGNQKVVQALIAAKADVNAKTDKGVTALILASARGNQKVVQALIAAKANVNAKDDDGNTALTWASENGYQEVVQALIAAKADKNAIHGISYVYTYTGHTVKYTSYHDGSRDNLNDHLTIQFTCDSHTMDLVVLGKGVLSSPYTMAVGYYRIRSGDPAYLADFHIYALDDQGLPSRWSISLMPKQKGNPSYSSNSPNSALARDVVITMPSFIWNDGGWGSWTRRPILLYPEITK